MLRNWWRLSLAFTKSASMLVFSSSPLFTVHYVGKVFQVAGHGKNQIHKRLKLLRLLLKAFLHLKHMGKVANCQLQNIDQFDKDQHLATGKIGLPGILPRAEENFPQTLMLGVDGAL